jgi:hypothetical protein
VLQTVSEKDGWGLEEGCVDSAAVGSALAARSCGSLQSAIMHNNAMMLFAVRCSTLCDRLP